MRGGFDAIRTLSYIHWWQAWQGGAGDRSEWVPIKLKVALPSLDDDRKKQLKLCVSYIGPLGPLKKPKSLARNAQKCLLFSVLDKKAFFQRGHFRFF